MELNFYSVRYRSMVVVNGLRILRVAVGRIQVSPMVAGGEMDKRFLLFFRFNIFFQI